MKKNNQAFSLTEVLVATVILSISVFGIYKLIGENTKLIHYSQQSQERDRLFSTVEQCIYNLSLNTQGNYDISLGTDLKECHISDTPVTTINNRVYYISGEITESQALFNDWTIYISSDELKEKTITFREIE